MQNINLLIMLKDDRKYGFLINSFPTRLTSLLTLTPWRISEQEKQTNDAAGKKEEEEEKKEAGFKPGIEQWLH